MNDLFLNTNLFGDGSSFGDDFGFETDAIGSARGGGDLTERPAGHLDGRASFWYEPVGVDDRSALDGALVDGAASDEGTEDGIRADRLFEAWFDGGSDSISFSDDALVLLDDPGFGGASLAETSLVDADAGTASGGALFGEEVVQSADAGDEFGVSAPRERNTARFDDPENLERPEPGEIDPPDAHDPAKERSLTPDEAAHLERLFGPELDTDRIRFVDGPARFGEGSFAAEAFVGEDGVTRIYLGSRNWSENFLQEAPGSRERSTFYHEVYHAAQYQDVVNAGAEGADPWDRDFAVNEVYDGALIWSGIDTDETTVEESAVIFEASLEAVQTGANVNDVLEGHGFTVEEDASPDALLERFTDGGYRPGDAYVPPVEDD